MQGIDGFIPTERKVNYINQLLKVGFDTIDFGSFVSPKAIPQMRDTREVIEQLDLGTNSTKLLAIVANTRGAAEAAGFDAITYLGYPLSISETFQQRNTNRSIVEALNDLQEIQEICRQNNKTLVTYISMGFGNPYDDPYDPEVVNNFVDILNTLEVRIISIADTIGVSNRENITLLFKNLIPAFPEIEFGAHLHSNPATATEKISAAYQAGCRRFDGAIKGYGGCPMAKDELVGNLATETILAYLKTENVSPEVREEEFEKSLAMASVVFQD